LIHILKFESKHLESAGRPDGDLDYFNQHSLEYSTTTGIPKWNAKSGTAEHLHVV
jgi:hypothetical protein